jgi:Spy/CpxP family protein refolding chaperone
MLRSIIFVVACLVALLGAEPRAESPQARQGAGRPNRPAADLSPGVIGDMMDAYAAVQAQDTLQLTETQYGQFVTRLRKLQQTRRQNQQARNQILGELRRILNPPATSTQAATAPDENAIRDRLKALRDHDDRVAVEMRRAYDALDEILDPRQQARFRLFEEQLERRKLDLLMRARQGARRGVDGSK